MEEGILVPLGVFAMVFGIVYLNIRKKERMMLLEKGMDIDTFRKEDENMLQLKWGMLLIGVAIGLLLGDIFAAKGLLEDWVAYFSMTFIFGGIALVTSYFVAKKCHGDEKNNRPKPM